MTHEEILSWHPENNVQCDHRATPGRAAKDTVFSGASWYHSHSLHGLILSRLPPKGCLVPEDQLLGRGGGPWTFTLGESVCCISLASRVTKESTVP